MENLYDADTFSLFDNEISGSIPENWSTVRTLVKIDLHGNVLSGSIPDSLGDLLNYNLDYLDLSENELSGAIPTFFDGAEDDFTYVDLSGNRFVCPIPSWAEYTQANCIEWSITGVAPLCVADGELFTVYGLGFSSVAGLACSLMDVDTGSITFATAVLVAEDTILCQAERDFTACNGTVGCRLYEYSTVSLTLNGQDLLSNSTSPKLGIINPYCSTATVQDVTGMVWSIPASDTTDFLCTTGNPTPFSCPTSEIEVEAKFDRDCVSGSNTTCYWAIAPDGLCPVAAVAENELTISLVMGEALLGCSPPHPSGTLRWSYEISFDATSAMPRQHSSTSGNHQQCHVSNATSASLRLSENC